MKNIIIGLALGLLTAGCTLDQRMIDAACEAPSTAYIYDYDNRKVTKSDTIAANSPLALEIHNWLNINADGWHISYNSFAPNIIIHNTNMNLNITAKYAVLKIKNPSSGKWKYFQKDIDITDIEFLKQVRAEQPVPGYPPQGVGSP